MGNWIKKKFKIIESIKIFNIIIRIDELLQGGLHPGEVTEISGETATGKTQVAK